MLDALQTMVESGEVAHADTRSQTLGAIDDILEAGRSTGQLRADVSAEDIAAALIGSFTVANSPQHEAMAARPLNLLMDGLRPCARCRV
jgi:hypothetical protein